MRKRLWSCRYYCKISSSSSSSSQQQQQQSQKLAAVCVPFDDRSGGGGGVLKRNDLLRKGRPDSPSGLHVLDLIDRSSLPPHRSLYVDLIKKCAAFKKLEEGRLVHAHLFRPSSPFSRDLPLHNHLLNMYVKCGSLDEARHMFDQLPASDVVSWTTLIAGYTQTGLADRAAALFPLMLRADVEPNQFTLSSLLKASGVRATDGFGKQLHSYCLKCGYCSDVYVGSALVDMYARWEEINEAWLIFDGLISKNEVSWNALIAAHARNGNGEVALSLFCEMLRADFKPTSSTYSSVFGALSSTGFLEQGKWVHAHMIKSGGQLITFVGNTLLDMYAKSGSIVDAEKVFSRLLRQDIVSWGSLLKGYAQHGRGKQTVEHFEEMLRIGVEPSHVTFLSVLTACSHAGLVKEGEYYFQLMKKYGLDPQISHYTTMVDLFGRAGLFDRTERFIRQMPIKPNAAVWGALLSACRMHKNMDLGAYAAEQLFELDPNSPGPHVLLSNIYASAGRWSDVAKVRSMMKANQVKKERAISWVDIENSVHIFVANDDTHPQREEIKKMWEEVNAKIKEMGYVPDTSHVLFYADQQEREERLQVHSEKLALAFALLRTPPRSTIRIKKNIRVCGDCHTAFKLASKAVDREIILRDTNRFHHFQHGSCSCGDYW